MNPLKLAIVLGLGAPALLLAADPLAAPNWDASLAAQIAAVPESQERLRELNDLARAGASAELQSRLEAVIRGDSLSQPQRDYVLFKFTVGLADAQNVDPAILERLRNVEAATLVPHPERATAGVPLYDIASAAEGVFQLGLRRDATNQASALLGAGANQWLDAWEAASRSQRAGFSDALQSASDDSLRGVLEASLARLPATPELTPIAGKSALILRDRGALEAVLLHGGGSELASILEAAALTLPAADSAALLRYAIDTAPPTAASLAIAQLYPELNINADATDLLFATLNHPELGGSAALALARGSTETRARLRQLAVESDGVVASRAHTALELAAQPQGARP